LPLSEIKQEEIGKWGQTVRGFNNIITIFVVTKLNIINWSRILSKIFINYVD
jgi:hypothetical protein